MGWVSRDCCETPLACVWGGGGGYNGREPIADGADREDSMQGQHSNQSSFFGLIYEDLVPADHLLRKLAAAVDFGFVSALVSDCYCPDNGRPSWDPLVLFKVGFLQFLY